MNLFRSEEHLQRWPLYSREVDDYVMSVADWGEVFSVPLFRNRLQSDYLACVDEYYEGYRAALAAAGKPLPPAERVVSTVLFTDIVDSTRLAASEGDEAWRSLLERHDDAVRNMLGHYEGREIKQTGDGFLACFDTPARAIHCATAIATAVRELGLQSRAGVHTGECEVRGEDLSGIAVHIGARIAALAGPDQVLVSRTVTDVAIGSGINFEARGAHELKGVPGVWEVYAVTE